MSDIWVVQFCVTAESATKDFVVVVVDGVVEPLPPHRVSPRRVLEPAVPQGADDYLC